MMALLADSSFWTYTKHRFIESGIGLLAVAITFTVIAVLDWRSRVAERERRKKGTRDHE